MKSMRYLVPILFMMFGLMIVEAQRGDRGGNGGADRTPIAPLLGTPAAEFTPSRNVEDLPTKSDIQATLESIEFDLPEPDPIAEAAIVSFAQTYLGLTVDPIYAGSLPDGDAKPRVGSSQADIDMPDEITAIFDELPDTIQDILSQASGTPYWGYYENGTATLYLDADCNGQCSIDMNSLQLTLSNGSLGTYTIYQRASVSDLSSAQNLIVSTYPALASYTLTPYTIENGYAFVGNSLTTGREFDATGFIAGVIPTQDGQALTYVTFGVGEGYIEVIP